MLTLGDRSVGFEQSVTPVIMGTAAVGIPLPRNGLKGLRRKMVEQSLCALWLLTKQKDTLLPRGAAACDISAGLHSDQSAESGRLVLAEAQGEIRTVAAATMRPRRGKRTTEPLRSDVSGSSFPKYYDDAMLKRDSGKWKCDLFSLGMVAGGSKATAPLPIWLE